ncbi:hypothetical protein PTTG_09849 [Puccinia triticina 1-1 BBBD Race 1]|uniref:Uncharacterized protein n=1 Tax=Puccinia triticina (isolate 1-1 / race 1 (BBBD)) TaxID=630390 RepID=A0A180GIX7_PUCT1|nr:hypothetical protein PTTG_09849 [Puccinia triticina 1-1 BBBD Race 1]
MTAASESHRLPAAPLPAPPTQQEPGHTSASLLRFLLTAPESQAQNGRVSLDAMMVPIILQLLDNEVEQKRQLQNAMAELQAAMKEMQRAMADLRDLRGRVQTIEAGQITKARPTPVKTYASTAVAKNPPPPAPPKQAEMVAARPGLSIIHARSGTAPLKDAKAEDVVRKANEILEKLDAKVNGEKVAIKAAPEGMA